jgi:hypothetical protein
MLVLAAASAEIDRPVFARSMADARVDEALAQDMTAGREPMPAAQVLDQRLANRSAAAVTPARPTRSRGSQTGVTISVPGIQPFRRVLRLRHGRRRSPEMGPGPHGACRIAVRA